MTTHSNPLKAESVHSKIMEAELYFRQGLFSDAQKIYTVLISADRARLVLKPDLSDSQRRQIMRSALPVSKKELEKLPIGRRPLNSKRVMPVLPVALEQSGDDAGGESVQDAAEPS